MTSSNHRQNPSENTTAGHGALRDPDRTEYGEREITFVWDLGEDPDGGARQAILSILHHRHSRGGAFSAALLNRTERKTPFGTDREIGPVGEWTRIASARVARYSNARLKAFALAAYSNLHDRYEQGEEQARRYFREQP